MANNFNFDNYLKDMGLYNTIDTSNLEGDTRARAEYYNQAVDILKNLNDKVRQNAGIKPMIEAAKSGVLDKGVNADLQDLRTLVTVLNSFSANMEGVLKVTSSMKGKADKETRSQVRDAVFGDKQDSVVKLLQDYKDYLTSVSNYELSPENQKELTRQLKKFGEVSGGKIEDEAKNLIKDCKKIIKENKGTQQPKTKNVINSISSFYGKKDMGSMISTARKQIRSIPGMSTATRQSIALDTDKLDEKFRSTFFKESSAALSKAIQPIIKMGETIGKVSGNVISQPASYIPSSDVVTSAYKQLIKEIDTKTTQAAKAIQATDTKQALTQMYDANKDYAFLDFENTYEKEGKHDYNSITHAPVTVGISKNGQRYEGLIVGDKDAIPRIVNFLTDAKLGRSREILAETMGLGQGYLGSDGKIYYQTAQSKGNLKISESDLMAYVDKYVSSAMRPGEVKSAVSSVMNQFGYQTKDYSVITAQGIQQELDKTSVWGANTKHDIGLYNFIADKKHQIDAANTGDIFDTILGDLHFASGYNVTALARLLLSPDEFDAMQAHGSGEDAYIEAAILAKYRANQKACDEIIKQFESQLEANYSKINPGKSAKRYNAAKERWEYTEDYKAYHGQSVDLYTSSLANKSVLNGASKDSVDKMIEANSVRGEFVNKIVGGIKGTLSEGHYTYTTGETARKRIANATGRDESQVATNSILDKIASFNDRMAQLGYYVDAQVVNDGGVGKIHFRMMPTSQYNFNPDLINNEDYASMFDITLAGDNSQVDKYNKNSIATLGWDYYTNDLEDTIFASADAAFNEAIRLAEQANETGNFEAKKNSSTIKWAGKARGDYGTYDATGKRISEEKNQKDPSAFEEERLQNTFYATRYYSEMIRHDPNLTKLLLGTMANYKGMVKANALNPYELDSNLVASMSEAVEKIMNLSDEDIEKYLYGVSSTGLDTSKDIVYQLLSSKLAEGFRNRVRNAAKKGLGGHLTSQSSGNVKSGKIGTKKVLSSAFQGIIGQEYSEGWVKTQQTGKNVKKFTKDELLGPGMGGFWKENAFSSYGKDKETSADLLVNVGSIPSEVIDNFYKKYLGVKKASSDDQMLMGQDFADTAEGVGAEKWSSGALSENTLKYLQDLGVDIDKVKSGIAGQLTPLIATELQQELRVNENFRIPVGAVLTGIRLDKEDGIQIHYRQTNKMKNATKITGLQSRMQASVADMSTKDLKKYLQKSAKDVFAEKKQGLRLKLKETDSLEERAAIQQQIDDLPNQLKTITEIIKTNTVFRETPEFKKSADYRVNAQHVAATYQRLIPNVKEFNRLSEEFKFLGDFFKVVGKGKDAKIAQVENFDWTKYTLSDEAKKIKIGDRNIQTVEEMAAYMHSQSSEWGMLSDIIKSQGITDKSKIDAILSSGAIQMDPRGASKFTETEGAGGLFDTAAKDVNEVANFRGTLALLRRTQEELDISKERLIQQFGNGNYQAGLKAFNEFSSQLLKGLIVQDKDIIERTNSILTAAQGNNNKKSYNAAVNKMKANNGKMMTIGFGKGNSKDYVDISSLDLTKKPSKLGGAFTKEEYSGSALDTIYSNFTGVGKANNLIQFDFESLKKEQQEKLREHGINGNILIGLSKQIIGKDESVNYEEEQRALVALLQKIQDILAGKEVNDKYITTTYQNALANMQKPLIQSGLGIKAADSAYLKTGASSEDYNWITEGTARNLLSIDRESKKQDIQEYIEIMYKNLGKSGKDISNAKRGSKDKLLQTANKALDEYMEKLLGMDLQQQMETFNLMISRSPFLTPYSSVLGKTAIIRDSEFKNPENYKDIIHIGKNNDISYADLLKADWDGDIIGVKIMFQNASEEFKQQLSILINERMKVINNTREIFKEEIGSEVKDLTKYQKTLIKNARTITNSNLVESLGNIVLSGNQSVGINNYTDEQAKAAIDWYRKEYKQENVSGEFDLASRLYSTVLTQLGQQVGISAKQMGALLLNNKGDLAFTAGTAGELFKAMTDETKNKYGWGGKDGEAEFTNQFNAMFEKSIVNTFGKLNVGEALTNMQARGLTGTGDTSEEQFYRKMAWFLSPQNKEFSASDFFSTLMSADGMKDMFKQIYSENNREAINSYFTSQFTNETGLVATRVFKNSDEVTQEARLAQIVTEKTMAQYAAKEAASGQKISLINQQLSQLISLVQQIADNGGSGGASDSKQYQPNKAWERILTNAKETDISISNNAEAELNKDNHVYKPLAGILAGEKIFSATEIGNGVLAATNPNLKAQLNYLRGELDSGRNVNLGIGLEEWKMNNFRGSERNLTMAASIQASSLVGNMYHKASELAVKEVQASGGRKTLSDIIENSDEWVNSINDKEYQDNLDKLVLLFNGSNEMAQAYIKTRGTIQENLKAGLSELIKAGVKDDASNVYVEKSLAANIGGKDKEGNKNSYNVAATLDNIVRDTVTGGFFSVDLKQKDVNGQVSPADTIEGFIQQTLLASKVTNIDWLKSHGVTEEEINNPERLKQIQESTANALTKFLKVDNGKAVLKASGLDTTGMEPAQMIYALIQKLLEGGGLNWKDLPAYQAFGEDFEGQTGLGFDAYKERYKLKLETQEEISKLESAATGLTPEQQSARSSQLELLRERLALTEKILGFTNQEKFTQEQLNELNLMRARSESRIADSKAKGQGNTSLSGQFMNSLNRRIERFFEFTMVQNVLNKLIGSIKQVIQYTQKLDACLVDIRIATGYSITQTRQLLLEYNNLAKQVGKTTEEVAKAANDWLRAGYEGKEATELVTASMYLSTLGMMESSQATEALISVLKGWKLQSDEVMGVVDKLVTVDMNAAVNNSRNI